MLLSGLYEIIPGNILSRRVIKEDVITPKKIQFLTAPEILDAETLYLADSAAVEKYLPDCSCPNGCVVLCSGEVAKTVAFQVNIQFIATDAPLPELYNTTSNYLQQILQYANIQEENLRRKFSDIIEQKATSSYDINNLCSTFPHAFKSSYCVICVKSEEPQNCAAQNYALYKDLQVLFPDDNITTYDNNIAVADNFLNFFKLQVFKQPCRC